MESDEDIYHAIPQVRGRIAHHTTDQKTYSTSRNEITSLHVCSEELGIYGVIDLYKTEQKMLVERKYQLRTVYRGQLYQLWAQYYCMEEMGYRVEKLAFYETSTNKMLPVALPSMVEKEELVEFIKSFKNYNPKQPLKVNVNKCMHCIYCNLCDKAIQDNVYT